MDAISAERIRSEIMKLYNRDPRRWHVLVGRDSRGYTSTIFLYGDKMWVLKEEPLNPYESIGLGLEVEEIDESLKSFVKNPYPFGFRPVSERYLRDILEAGITERTIERMLGKKPVSTEKISSPAIVGPVTMPTKPIEFVSKRQIDLDEKLGKELDKLIHKKRPDLFLPYV